MFVEAFDFQRLSPVWLGISLQITETKSWPKLDKNWFNTGNDVKRDHILFNLYTQHQGSRIQDVDEIKLQKIRHEDAGIKSEIIKCKEIKLGSSTEWKWLETRGKTCPCFRRQQRQKSSEFMKSQSMKNSQLSLNWEHVMLLWKPTTPCLILY